jgi:phosphoglycolate phosphatase-like HAD superfamily hydrolase
MSVSDKQIILFDVDKTLFDVNLLIRKLLVIELPRILNISLETFQQRDQAYRQTLEKNTDFNPTDYLRAISLQSDVEELGVKTIFNPNFHQQAVFPDVIPCLTKLAKSYQLGVFSEANLEWQQKKLKLSGLINFFIPELVFIWRRKTAPEQLKQLPSPVTIVDDNTNVIAALTQVPTITPIWINRVNAQPLVGVTTITSLTELKTILAN